MPEPRSSNWTRAEAPSTELLALILMLVAEWITLTNRLPTVAELQQALRHPGS